MSESWYHKHVDRIARDYGYDAASVLQVSERFKALERPFRERAVARAFETDNRGQIEILVCIANWMDLSDLQVYPPVFDCQSPAFDFWKDAWMVQIKKSAANGVDLLDRMPFLIARNPEVMKCRRQAFKAWLAHGTAYGKDRIKQLPKQFANDRAFLRVRRNAWSSRLSGRVQEHVLKEFPKDLLEIKSVKEGWRRAWAAVSRARVLSGNDSRCDFPERLWSEPYMMRSRRRDWFDYFQAKVEQELPPRELLPDDLKRDPKICSAWAEAWKVALRADPLARDPQRRPVASLPEEMQCSEAFLQLWEAQWVRWLKNKAVNYLRPFEIPSLLKVRPGIIGAYVHAMVTYALAAESPEEQLREFINAVESAMNVTPLSHFWTTLRTDLETRAACCAEGNGSRKTLHRLQSGIRQMLLREREYKQKYLQLLAIDGKSHTRIPGPLCDDRDIREAWCQSWLRGLSYPVIADLSEFDRVPELLKGEEKMRALIDEAWIHAVILKRRPIWDCPERCLPDARLQARFVNLHALPDEVLADPRLMPVWKRMFALDEGIVKALEHAAANSGLTSSMVDLWRHSPDPERQSVVSGLRALRERPWNFGQLSAAARAHPLLLACASEAMLGLLRTSDVYHVLLPEELKRVPQIRKCVSEHRARMREARRRAGEIAAKEEAKRRRKLVAQWAQRIRNNPISYAEMPVELRSQPALLRSLRENLGPQIQRNPGCWESLPAVIREEQCLRNVHRIATRNLNG